MNHLTDNLSPLARAVRRQHLTDTDGRFLDPDSVEMQGLCDGDRAGTARADVIVHTPIPMPAWAVAEYVDPLEGVVTRSGLSRGGAVKCRAEQFIGDGDHVSTSVDVDPIRDGLTADDALALAAALIVAAHEVEGRKPDVGDLFRLYAEIETTWPDAFAAPAQ